MNKKILLMLSILQLYPVVSYANQPINFTELQVRNRCSVPVSAFIERIVYRTKSAEIAVPTRITSLVEIPPHETKTIDNILNVPTRLTKKTFKEYTITFDVNGDKYKFYPEDILREFKYKKKNLHRLDTKRFCPKENNKN